MTFNVLSWTRELYAIQKDKAGNRDKSTVCRAPTLLPQRCCSALLMKCGIHLRYPLAVSIASSGSILTFYCQYLSHLFSSLAFSYIISIRVDKLPMDRVDIMEVAVLAKR